MDQLQALALVALATLLGGIVGFERERSAKPAGLRTHMLVAAGAALVVTVGEDVFVAHGDVGDPNRALHAVITGIGFLGAGTILRDRSEGTVTGLTTATSLLLAAAIGIATGFGMILLAVGVTLLLVTVLFVVGHVEAWLVRHLGHREPAEQDEGGDIEERHERATDDRDQRSHA